MAVAAVVCEPVLRAGESLLSRKLSKILRDYEATRKINPKFDLENYVSFQERALFGARDYFSEPSNHLCRNLVDISWGSLFNSFCGHLDGDSYAFDEKVGLFYSFLGRNISAARAVLDMNDLLSGTRAVSEVVDFENHFYNLGEYRIFASRPYFSV